YRNHFKAESPTAQISEPFVSVGGNVMVAETSAEAVFQCSTAEQMFGGINSGRRAPLPPPVENIEAVLGGQLAALAQRSLSIKAVGDQSLVVEQLEEIVDATGANELITVTYSHDPQVRLDSLQLLAEAWGLTPPLG